MSETEPKNRIIAVVGAGGKTSFIHTRAEACAEMGLSVFVTTTTHMMREPGMLLHPDREALLSSIRKGKTVVAGTDAGEQKFGPLPEDLFREAASLADITFVEADGARHHLLKVPRETEPVIPEGTSEIVLVFGEDAVGKAAGEAVHHPELAPEFFPQGEETIIILRLIERLGAQKYILPLRAAYPDIPIRFLLASWKDGKRVFRECSRKGE